MYNKLFTSILDSSIWEEDNRTRIVWITFLAAMDQDGFCRFGCLGNVARRANLSPEDAQYGIDVLGAPDIQNPHQENDGRRIEPVDGGFMVLNHGKYSSIGNSDQNRQSNRDRQRRYRERQKEKADVTDRNARVTESNPSDTDTDSDSDTDTEKVYEKGADAKASDDSIESTGLKPGGPPEQSMGPEGQSLPANRSNEIREQSEDILRYLNERAGKHFRKTKTHLDAIEQRLKGPGIEFEEVKKMIDSKCEEWGGGEMEKYLTPQTLFRASKFDVYYDGRNEVIKKGRCVNGKYIPSGGEIDESKF